MIKQNPTKSVIRFFDIREKPNNNGEMPLHKQQQQQQQQPPPLPSFRSRKLVRNTRKISFSIASILVILSLIVFFSILAYYFLSTDTDLNTIHRHHEKELKPDTDFLENVTRMESDQVSSFGGGGGGDSSRYWDRDDRSKEKKADPPPPPPPPHRRHHHHHHIGRDELKIYEKEFAASLKNNGVHNKEEFLEVENNKQMDGFEDESDDAIDSQDHEDRIHENEKGIDNAPAVTNEYDVNGVRSANGSVYEMGSDLRPPLKHHKFAGSSCEIEFLNTTAQLVEPVENEKFSRFSLQYTDVEERPSEQEQWEPRFAGHQSLKEREESFYAHDQKINCGFIKGPKGYSSTGFDLEEDDKRYMRSCHIAVSSCIFGNSDKLKSPFGKTVTRLSRKNVCFVMFIDESTLQALFSEGQVPDKLGFIGFWKIVVVKNLPFADMRRVGKIPKLLAHRLFPSARYSIWLDSKLRLQSDPLLILEFFLWRKGYEYAISNHYRRHCVWEEVAQNKRLNKFNHTIIDKQFLFYKADGLKRFNSSNPDKLLPSNVPEGSFIMRAHTSMSNLFSCLWYNEIDRFTPRDQLSFAYVYQKLRRTNPEKLFHLNMFKDCERRAIAKLFHHKSEEERNIPFESVG